MHHRDIDRPRIKPNEVLLRARAAGRSGAGTHRLWAALAVVLVIGTAGLVAPVPARAAVLPTALADRIVTDEDTPRTFDPLANDSGDLLPSSVRTFPPAHGAALVEAASGRITYTPTDHYNGVDAFSYGACDAAGACVNGQVDVVVNLYGRYRMVVTSPPNQDFTGPIELMHPDGTGPRDDVSAGPGTFGGGFFGKISPDGTWLAIASGGSVGFFNLEDELITSTSSFPGEVLEMAWAPDSSKLVGRIGLGGPNRLYYRADPNAGGSVEGPLGYTLPDANGAPVPVPVHGNGATWGPGGITISDWYEYTTPTSGLLHSGLATFNPGETPRVRSETPGLSEPAAGSDGRLAMRCPAGLCTMAAGSSAPMTLVPMPSFQVPLRIEWSPDDSKIAFNLTDSDRRAAVVNADGTGLRELNINGRVLNPAWDPRPFIPDRPWDVAGELAFVHDRVTNGEEQRTIETTRPDGSGRRSVPLGAGELAVDVAWSPDGRRLAISVTSPGWALVTLRVMDADGGNPRDLATDVIGTFDWSPSGDDIVFGRRAPSGEADLYVVSADGSAAPRMIDVSQPTNDNFSPSYSPDGQYVLYRALATSGTRLYVVRADGSAAPTEVAGFLNGAQLPDVSSQSKLVYVEGGLWVGDVTWAPAPAVSGVRQITASGVISPRWSPDGRAIAYLYGQPRRVWVVNSDGSRTTQVAYDITGNQLSVVWGSRPPELTGLTPALGPTAGGTTVTLNGTSIGGPGTVVTFGGEPATVVSGSPTSLVVTTPAHAFGRVDVAVTNPGGETTVLNGAFVYTDAAAPTLSAIDPAAGPAAGGTEVTLTGSGFGGPGTLVSFGGSPATVTGGGEAFINVTSPTHAGGPVDVVVANPDGQTATLAGAYTYRAGPTITSVVPDTGPSVGGATVTITGTDFGGPGTTVTIGGTSATISSGSTTSLTFVAPAHSAGTVDVVVTNTDGQQAVAAGAFTFRDGPTVQTIAPSQGPAAGGTAVTIGGAGFGGPGTTVTFGGIAATIVSGSPDALDVVSPAHATGSVDVVVTNPDGQQATATLGFRYVIAPSIQSLSPSSGTALGGTSVTIAGADFGGPGTSVSFGGTNATIMSGSTTALTVQAPAHAAGTVDVVVTNPDGQTATRPGGFTYLAAQPAPVLRSLKPASGTIAGGVKVTLVGTNFRAGMVVTFGGAQATAVVVTSATKATLRTPPHVAGRVDVTVTNTDGQESTLPASFTFKAPRRA